MTDLVQKLQLQLDQILLKFASNPLNVLCIFPGVQEPEYEGKTKRQLVKHNTELLINFIGKPKKVTLTSKPPVRRAVVNNESSKRLYGTDNTGLKTSHNIDTDVELRIIREKEADLIRRGQILK